MDWKKVFRPTKLKIIILVIAVIGFGYYTLTYTSGQTAQSQTMPNWTRAEVIKFRYPTPNEYVVWEGERIPVYESPQALELLDAWKQELLQQMHEDYFRQHVIADFVDGTAIHAIYFNDWVLIKFGGAPKLPNVEHMLPYPVVLATMKTCAPNAKLSSTDGQLWIQLRGKGESDEGSLWLRGSGEISRAENSCADIRVRLDAEGLLCIESACILS